MENIEIEVVEYNDGTTQENVIIDRGNGDFTSMLKSTYDEMIAKRETPSL
jgi:hypothetical protein